MYFDFFTEINIKEFAVIECIDVLDIDIEGYILDDINQVRSSWNDKAYALKEGKYRITCSFKYLTGGGAYNRYSFENKTQKVSEIFTLEKGKLYRFRILECSAVFNNKIPYKIVLSKSLENEKKKLTIVFEERIV
ncbi:hypothetical protein [Apibacter sp. HY039]|uniref:hypothetical protein n=1 Tax=Apibacter sp. HY039 TaxID=2501476 RepID=UPI000FEBB890|nr:hypothetical protein [Apibacter sp. HY039]